MSHHFTNLNYPQMLMAVGQGPASLRHNLIARPSEHLEPRLTFSFSFRTHLLPGVSETWEPGRHGCCTAAGYQGYGVWLDPIGSLGPSEEMVNYDPYTNHLQSLGSYKPLNKLLSSPRQVIGVSQW